MSARVCDRCHYNIVSQVVTACPNCGSPLPRRASSTGPVLTLISIAFLALLAVGGITIMREAVRMRETTPPSTSAVPPPTRPGPRASSRPPVASGAVAGLVSGLGSSDVARRREAAEKLAEAGDRTAANALLRALKDRDDTVRQLSVYALARMSTRGAVPPGDRATVAAAVRPLLNDRYELARSTAAYALGELRDRSAVPGLLRALNDASATVRSMSATALGTLKDPRAVPPLIPLLSDETTVWAAAQALGEIGGDQAESVLLDAYAKRNLEVMAGAHAFYLRRRTPGYDKVLLELLQARNDLAIAQTLILSNDPRLSGPARKWATDHGWALVKDPKSPTGVSWTPAGTP